MVSLDTFKLYLKDLKYPGFDLMPDEEVPNIFCKANRLNFLTWFFNNWHPDITFPVDDKNKSDMLSELLYDNGFCSRKESIKFVHDDLKLSPEEQVLILNKMLYNLKVLQSEKETSSCEVNYVTQTEIFQKLDLNLFPSYGPLKHRTPKEQSKKLKEYDDDILKLIKEIEILNTEDDLNLEIDKNDLSFDSIDLKQEVPLLLDTLTFEKVSSTDIKAGFNDNFTQVTGDCDAKILAVSKLHENKRLINEFNVHKRTDKNEGSEDIYKKIQDLANFSEEILNMN